MNISTSLTESVWAHITTSNLTLHFTKESQCTTLTCFRVLLYSSVGSVAAPLQ